MLVDNRFAVVYTHSNLGDSRFKNFVAVHPNNNEQLPYKVHPLVVEFGGAIRYVLAFLATLNNMPKVETVIRPQKGFLGGGQIRKYQDYTTLTLRLPAKTTKVNLARRLMAMARKGWHEVRPHWRMLNDGSCGPYEHIWSERDETKHSTCNHCSAKRVWITLPNGRGDPTISIRTHKYRVTHDWN